MVAGSTHANYSVSPDGRTFAMVRRSVAGGIVALKNIPALISGKDARD